MNMTSKGHGLIENTADRGYDLAESIKWIQVSAAFWEALCSELDRSGMPAGSAIQPIGAGGAVDSVRIMRAAIHACSRFKDETGLTARLANSQDGVLELDDTGIARVATVEVDGIPTAHMELVLVNEVPGMLGIRLAVVPHLTGFSVEKPAE